MFQRLEIAAPLTGVSTCRAFFADCVAAGEDSLWVAFLDGGARCIHLARFPRDARRGAWPIRRIIQRAAELESAGLVVAKRDGDAPATAVRNNEATARHLALAAEAVGVVLLDHLVFTRGDCTSMRRAGVL